MMQRFGLLLALILRSNLLSGQKDLTVNDNYFTITGTIKDKLTGDVIPYAHVGIPEFGIGTTTSENGEFSLKVQDDFGDSKLMVSYIGYKTYRMPVSNIDGVLTILLEQSAANLTEIIVMGDNKVLNIVETAIKNIPKNYPTKGLTHQGFYRESRTDSSMNYVYLAEGVLKIYKKGYKSKKPGYVGLVQGRVINLRDPLDTVVTSGFGSGHMAAHRFDFVKNREDFINKDLLPLYKYRIESITTYNDRPVYIIAFEPHETGKTIKKKGDNGFITIEQSFGEDSDNKIWSFFGRKKKVELKGRLKGKMYIDKESFAFIRAEFEITKHGLKKWNDYPLYSGRWKANKYTVNYRQLGEKWYFSDAYREGHYGSGGLYNNEIKITEINTKPSGTLPYQERMQKHSEFAMNTGQYDEGFWKNYNTTPLSEALVESVRQMENSKKAAEVFDPVYLASLQAKRDSIRLAERTMTIVGEDGETKTIIEPIEPGAVVTESSYKKFRTHFGLGTHLLTTNAQNFGLFYKDGDGAEILSLTDDISKRDFEVIGAFGFDIHLHKNFFIRTGTSFDFINSIYKEVSLGLGTQLNLSKGRPFTIRAIAEVDRWHYARKVGQAENSYGKFEVNKKNFKAKKINLYYGSRTYNLKFSAELALELFHNTEVFIRGTYYMPFSSRQDVWFFERRELFRKKRFLPASDEGMDVFSNDAPYSSDIVPAGTFSVMIGMTF